MTFKRLLPSKTLVKFSIVSALSFALDFALFTALHLWLGGLFLPLIMARLVSASFNFYQNKITVYRAQKTGRVKKEIASYFLLAVMVFGLGYVLILLLITGLGWNVILAKVLVDAALFFGNYLLQKWIVF